MFQSLTRKLSGDPKRRQLEAYAARAAEISALEPQLRQLSDAELRAKTDEFRRRLAQGETLDDLLVEAFATVREVAVRTTGLRHFDVQLIGGVALHEGMIAEMRTGEGKTLVATMPIYLNALEGKGVHLVTVNDYLARRDARWMGPIYHALGLSVGVLQEAARTENGRKAFLYDPERPSTQEDVDRLRIVDRQAAYAADVTYGTNNEFGFDYLRDNMAPSIERRVQRGHHYAILDEVDNILIDEARTPLIISGPSHEDPELYVRMAQVVRQLKAEEYEVNERDRTISLTEAGEDHVEAILGTPLRDPDRPEDITIDQARMMGHLEQALRAEHLYKRNKEYVVQGGRVIIVDEFTGRLMPGRRWSDGLHQAVEAKEAVKVRQENVTYATITLQNYFRKYAKLAGMTGTAMTEAEEFNKIYKVDVISLPTNLEHIAMRPGSDLVQVEYRENGSKFLCFGRREDPEQRPVFWVRKDYPDVVFRTEEAKFRAICAEILWRHVRGQPLLVGTTSVEHSEFLSARMRAEMLQRLAQVLILRDAYLETHGVPDEGRRIPELDVLYQPLEKLDASVLRPLAHELEVSLHPTRPENIERLARLLGLEAGDHERLVKSLEGGIRHNVLNAKKHDEESRIIADAGALGAVTIATNMAGRGVDIRLGGEIAEEVLGAVNRVLRRAGVEDVENLSADERLAALNRADDAAIGIYGAEVELFRKFMQAGKQVREVGGLHVLGSQRHEARRIDNQLRGRSARQGDPGSSQFYLSLGDELMRLFGGVQVSALMQRLNIDDAVPIAHNIVDKTIEQAQARVEGANFDTRKHLLEYDDVLNQQREVFYGQRDRMLTKDDLSEDLEEMLGVEVERHVQLVQKDPDELWKLLAWLEEIQPSFNLDSDHPLPSFMLKGLIESMGEWSQPAEAKSALIALAGEALDDQYEHLASSIQEQVSRTLERLDDQVRQQVEAAEMAMEGAALEAEETGREPTAATLLSAVENAADLRIQLQGDAAQSLSEDPQRLRRMLPDMVKAGLGLRVWSGLVQTVERRLGESLGVVEAPKPPIDWREAEDRLMTALGDTWQARREQLLAEIERELELALSKVSQVDEKLLLRLLVQMSFGRRTLFDRKTHTRRSMVVARLMYPYTAARRIDVGREGELQELVIGHLNQALEALKQAIGGAEIARLATRRLAELDQRWKDALIQVLGQETFDRAASAGSLSALPPDLRQPVQMALGHVVLMAAYRSLFLAVGDRLWVEYLTQMEALRTSIGLEAYGQRDPLVQYKSRAFDMFQQLLVEIRAGIVSRLLRVHLASRAQAEAATEERAAQAMPVAEGRGQGADAEAQPKKKRRRRHR